MRVAPVVVRRVPRHERGKRNSSMKRRAFLSGALSAATATLFARHAFAQGTHDAMHAMHGMSSMPAMSGSMMQSQGALAAADALPAGAPLAALRTLANESREPGQFRATLIAQPAGRALLPGRPQTVFWQYDAGAAAENGGPVIGPLIDVREGDTVEL